MEEGNGLGLVVNIEHIISDVNTALKEIDRFCVMDTANWLVPIGDYMKYVRATMEDFLKSPEEVLKDLAVQDEYMRSVVACMNNFFCIYRLELPRKFTEDGMNLYLFTNITQDAGKLLDYREREKI